MDRGDAHGSTDDSGAASDIAEPSPVAVLLIDDDDLFAERVERLLANGPHRPVSLSRATTLDQGIGHLAQRAADVILLDLSLPDTSGTPAIVHLRAHGFRAPIIVLADNQYGHEGMAALRSGADDFMLKADATAGSIWRAIWNAMGREALQQELEESRARLELVIRGSTDGIWDWDLRSGKIFYSRRWRSLLALDEDEVGDTLGEWRDRIHPDDREAAMAALDEYLQRRTKRFEHEHRLRQKDGTYRWVLARGEALWDLTGSPYRMAGALVDITETKEREEELRATQMRLIQAEKMHSLGRLAAGTAHEVKNPLATIWMGLEYLALNIDGADSNTAAALEEMRHAAERADMIVKGLLEYSAPVMLNMQEENLNAVVKKALSFVRHELATHQTELIRDLADNLPPVAVDKNKVMQVLVNLYTNSLQAMGEGGVLTVRTYQSRLAALAKPGREDRQMDPGVVVVEVLDTGPGISNEHLARVFDVFFTTKQPGEGTGLGLAVAKTILEMHGAGIQIVNRAEGGAKATITFLL